MQIPSSDILPAELKNGGPPVTMYQLICSQGLLPIHSREAPAGIGALVVAELLYKFYSFTLECLAFLATWYVFGWLSHFIVRTLEIATTARRS
jgi:hypothetical protein